MTDPAGGVLVLGIGNMLRRDDGVGPHVIRELERLTADDPGALPPGARALDGGTGGIDLLPHLEGTAALVVVDAVDLGLAPGAVHVLRGDGITAAAGPPDPTRGFSGVGELLATARLLDLLPPEVTLIGVQIEDVGAGLELSPSVAAALPAVVDAVRDEAGTRLATVTAAGASELAGAVP